MALCGIAVLVTLVILLAPRRPGTRPAPRPAVAVVAPVAGPHAAPSPTPAPEPTAAPEPTLAPTATPLAVPLKLVARVECSLDCAAEHLGARVGLGAISEADRATYEQLKAQSSDGPVSVNDLARPSEWKEAPISPAGHEARIGPLDVPRADVYFLLAWSSDGRRFGWKSVPIPDPLPANGEIDGGTVPMKSTTGIEIRFINVPAGVKEVLLSEASLALDPDSLLTDGLAFQTLQKLSRPDVSDLLAEDGTMLLDASQPQEIAPLPPAKGIGFRLGGLAGRKSERVDVALKPGELTTVELDLTKLLGADAGRFLELDGRLVRADNGQPLAGIPIERRKAPVEDIQTTDADGRFHFATLPVDGESLFAVNMVEPEMGKRSVAASDIFSFRPSPAEQSAAKATVEWRLTVYRWLVLEVPKELRSSFEIFTLQRQNPGSLAWSRTGSSEFVKEEGRVAVAVREPGTYRVLMSRGLLEVTPSQSAVFDETTAEMVVQLDRTHEIPARAVHAVVRDAAGKPVPAVLVRLMAPGGEPLPTESHTNDQGESLPETSNLGILTIEVENDGGTLFSGDVQVGPDGTAEVRLPITAPPENAAGNP